MNVIVKYLGKKLKFDAHYFLRGGAWLMMTQGVTVLLGIITTALFANFLTEHDYGVYRYLVGLAVIISTFSLTGLGQAVLQAASKGYNSFYTEARKVNFLYSLPISFIGTAGAYYYYLSDNHELAFGCALIALLHPFISALQYGPTLLLGNKQFKKSSQLLSLRAVIVSAVSTISILFTHNVLVLFATYLGAQLIANLITERVAQYSQVAALPDSRFIEYLNFAKHTSLRNILLLLAHRLDSILIFTYLGAAELAIYTIATVIPEQLKGSIKNLVTLSVPKFAQKENFVAVKRSVLIKSLPFFLALCAIATAYVFMSPVLFQLLFPKYIDVVWYSQLYIASLPLLVLYLPYTALQTRLDESALYKISILNSIFQIACTSTLIMLYGLLGAIIARILSRLFFLLSAYILLYTK